MIRNGIRRYGSEGWGFESLRARSVLRRTLDALEMSGAFGFLDEPAGQRPVVGFQPCRRGGPDGCSVQWSARAWNRWAGRHPYIYPYIVVGMGCGSGLARVVFTVVDE